MRKFISITNYCNMSFLGHNTFKWPLFECGLSLDLDGYNSRGSPYCWLKVRIWISTTFIQIIQKEWSIDDVEMHGWLASNATWEPLISYGFST